ncbi:corticotropin-releasing factor receptor 2-like [Ciona intestinalis]
MMKDAMLRIACLVILQMFPDRTSPKHTATMFTSSGQTTLSPQPIDFRSSTDSNARLENTSIRDPAIEEACNEYRSIAANYTNKREVLERIMTSQAACQVIHFCEMENKFDGFCPSMIDGLGTCFHQSKSGQTASVSCLEELNGIPYNTSDTVTRKCLEGGRWENRSEYNCRPILDEIVCKDVAEFFHTYGFTPKEKQPCEIHFANVVKISMAGRGLSLFALIVAFIIFCSIRSQWSYRSGCLYIIHWNFVMSLMLRNVLWICLYFFMGFSNNENKTIICPIMVTVFNYGQTTSYCWMFLEGIYLHRYVAIQLGNDDKLSWRFYVTVGWGFPVLIMSAWAATKSVLETGTCWLPGQSSSNADYIFKVPVLIALLINFVIMINVIRILVVKLCNPPARRPDGSSIESTHYFKTAKAALVLFPLLGLTYVLFIISPGYGTTGETVFLYFNTVLDSFQGFFVCLVYYYAHHDVQVEVSKKLRRVKSWVMCTNRKEYSRQNHWSRHLSRSKPANGSAGNERNRSITLVTSALNPSPEIIETEDRDVSYENTSDDNKMTNGLECTSFFTETSELSKSKDLT